MGENIATAILRRQLEDLKACIDELDAADATRLTAALQEMENVIEGVEKIFEG